MLFVLVFVSLFLGKQTLATTVPFLLLRCLDFIMAEQLYVNHNATHMLFFFFHLRRLLWVKITFQNFISIYSLGFNSCWRWMGSSLKSINNIVASFPLSFIHPDCAIQTNIYLFYPFILVCFIYSTEMEFPLVGA